MSDQPKWMPSAVRIQGAMAGGWPSVEREIRTAVEKALAEEWKKNLDAKEELIRRFRELQTEQEARHKREVIEARLDEIDNVASDAESSPKLGESVCEQWVYDWSRERETQLRAELAALDKEASHE